MLDDAGKIFGLVVDAARGAELLAGFYFFIRAGGGIHRVAQGTCKLNGGNADAAAPTLNQQAFSGLDGRAIKHIAPDCEESLR